MYTAARVYKDFDKEFASKCEKAAGPALSAYIAHMDDRNYTNPEGVNTGEYPDGSSVDEFFWAICEGYKTTGDGRFAAMIDKVDFSRIESDGFGWDDMSGYAFYAYMTADDALKVPVDIKGRFIKMCNGLKDTALNGEAYGCTITDDYPWGSNMYVANNAMALLMAHQLTGDDDYRLAAKRQLDYLFGTNTTSYCFLTGYGTQAPQHPHHRPSQAIGKCMKGMLVGGPNSRLEDPYAKTVLANEAKAKCYVDNDQSYSCNEVTIYWNSPLVYVLAGLK
jgi:endoglucanase